MAEYLCDEASYPELESIPSNLIDRNQAFRNVNQLLEVMNALISHKRFLTTLDSEVSLHQTYMSWRDLPDLLSKALNGLTLINFLDETFEEKLFASLDSLKRGLLPLVDLFFEYQLIDVVSRLKHLLGLLKRDDNL